MDSFIGLLLEIVSAIEDGKDDENLRALWTKMNVLRDIIPWIVNILYSEKKDFVCPGISPTLNL